MSSAVRTRSDFTVETIQQIGSDLMIAQAAWVATGRENTNREEMVHHYSPHGTDSPESLTEFGRKVQGILKFLVEKRHGTPFEHGSLTLRIEAPIFIWREFHRHRIGFSYNEESGRYKQLEPVFYIPGEERRKHCLKPEGFKPSQPGWRGFLERSNPWFDEDNAKLLRVYADAYSLYEARLSEGYDNGLARIDLPVSIYSACYVTCNPRSLMAFLSLRVDDENSLFRSHPLWEMDAIARLVEEQFQRYWPITHRLWNENKRVAP